MILTNCAACAAPLAHDAPRCVRCKVRYCDSSCQSHDYTFTLRKILAEALYQDPGATHDDLREAVTTLAVIERRARRVFGGAHPRVRGIERSLGRSRAVLQAREDA